jgi:hypothetical protein
MITLETARYPLIERVFEKVERKLSISDFIKAEEKCNLMCKYDEEKILQYVYLYIGISTALALICFIGVGVCYLY